MTTSETIGQRPPETGPPNPLRRTGPIRVFRVPRVVLDQGSAAQARTPVAPDRWHPSVGQRLLDKNNDIVI